MLMQDGHWIVPDYVSEIGNFSWVKSELMHASQSEWPQGSIRGMQVLLSQSFKQIVHSIIS